MVAAVTLLPFIATGILAAGPEPIEKIVDPEELSNLALPPPAHTYDNWTDWETWEASPEVAKLLPYYRSGYDYDGLVVYVVDYGKLGFREVGLLPKEKIQEFWKYYEQFVRRAGRDAAISNDQGIVFVQDWDDFSLKRYASKAALQAALKMFTSIVRFQGYIKYGFLFNVNYSAETFLNIAKPLTGNILDKLEIYGTRAENWKPVVLRSIPASQLPPKYGGTKDWKSLPVK